MPRIAAIQMVSTDQLETNLARAAQLLQEAAGKGSVLAVLPENFACMGHKDADKLAVVETPGDGPIQDWLSTQAQRFGIWIIGGSMLLRDPGHERPHAASLVVDAQGQVQARYNKMHLFDVDLPGGESYRESRLIEPGDTPVVVDTPVGRIGLSICYDLRFPELFRKYSSMGVDILSIPSAFTRTTGQAHWDVLVRARAIESLAYVIAPNQGGMHSNGRATYGATQVVDPWGQVMGRLQVGTGMVLADLDLPVIEQRRNQFPVLQHRRI